MFLPSILHQQVHEHTQNQKVKMNAMVPIPWPEDFQANRVWKSNLNLRLALACVEKCVRKANNKQLLLKQLCFLRAENKQTFPKQCVTPHPPILIKSGTFYSPGWWSDTEFSYEKKKSSKICLTITLWECFSFQLPSWIEAAGSREIFRILTCLNSIYQMEIIWKMWKHAFFLPFFLCVRI